MAFYGFEYFSGANVVVSIEGFPVLEAAGISYEARDSKMPIYGYSSRHYDAVAAGQVIVQGTLLINYVHQDYLYRAIQRAVGQIDGSGGSTAQPLLSAEEADLAGLTQDFERAAEFIQDMRERYWASLIEPTNSGIARTRNPHDMGGFDISIAYGEQSSFTPAGKTAVLIRDVHFTGRAQTIRIDEEVIVEAYPFFARDTFSLRNPYRVGTVTVDDENVDIEQQVPETATVIESQ